MSIEELAKIAELLKGQQVIVDMMAGDKFSGVLNSVRVHTGSLEKAIELSDENGKGTLVPLKIIQNIEKAE